MSIPRRIFPYLTTPKKGAPPHRTALFQTERSFLRDFTNRLLDRFPTFPQSSAASADHIVSSVQTYISAHYGEQLSLDQLAQQFYLSSSYLSRLFKRETGTTLTTYLQNVRIEAAKNLLRTTALKSYEVAERVGINDPVYFSRIFKKITGLKPKDYRHSVQNESSV